MRALLVLAVVIATMSVTNVQAAHLPRRFRRDPSLRYKKDESVTAEKFKLQTAAASSSANDCSNGIGPTCGPFPIPDNLKIDPTKSILTPIYKTGFQTFAVFSRNDFAAPNELVDIYGFELDYAPTRNGKGAQTGFGVVCPVTNATAHAFPIQTYRTLSASYLRSKGLILPDAQTHEIMTPPTRQGWPSLFYSVAWGDYGQELISLFVGIASQGVCVIFQINSPGDLTAPDSPTTVRTRYNSLKLAVPYVQQHFQGIIGMENPICSGTSNGGQACQVTINGWASQNIAAPFQQLFPMLVLSDPAGDVYASPEDFAAGPGYAVNQVEIKSENTGDVLGMQLRGQRQNIIGPNGINSVVATLNTTHGQFCGPYICIWSQISVETGAFFNLTKYNISTTWWAFPNQAVNGFCAVSVLPQMATKPFMPLTDQQNIHFEFLLRAIFAIQVGQFALQAAFSVTAIEELQKRLFNNQSMFTYYGNQICGPNVLGGCNQGKQLANTHQFYDYGYVNIPLSSLIDSEFDYSPGNSYGTAFGNYCGCLRNGQPCPVYSVTEPCSYNATLTCTSFPQVPRHVLAQDPTCNCPRGNC